MSTNNIPDFQKIMLPLLKYLEDGQPHAVVDWIDALSRPVYKILFIQAFVIAKRRNAYN